MECDSLNAKLETDAAEFQTLTAALQQKYFASGVMDGATIAICRSDGVAYLHYFGGHRPNKVYTLASITKIITSLACLQLQEHGKLDLNDPVSKHLSSFRGVRRGGPGAAKVESDAMTLLHCLNHTAGLTYLSCPVCEEEQRTPLEQQEERRCISARKDLETYVDEFLAKTPLMFSPGTQFNYADGHNVAARVIEVCSGEDFASYISSNLFSPLGMNAIGFPAYRISGMLQSSIAHPRPIQRLCCTWPRHCLARIRSKLMRLKYLSYRHSIQRAKTTASASSVSKSTAGASVTVLKTKAWGDLGLRGTAQDLIKLNRMLLNKGMFEGTRVLSSESVELLTRNSLDMNAELTAPFAFDGLPYFDNEDDLEDDENCKLVRHQFGVKDSELLNCRPLNSYPGQGFGVGMAVVLDPFKAGLHPDAKGTCWWQGYPSVYFAVNPETDIGCVIMGNDGSCFENHQILADVINAAHETLTKRGDLEAF